MELRQLEFFVHGRGEATGRLVVALPPSVSSVVTSPLVRRFRERLPLRPNALVAPPLLEQAIPLVQRTLCDL